MYSKCGTLEEAYMSFSEVPVKDIKLWTSIINVYEKLGNIKQCLSRFIEMLISGINPDPMVPCIEREEFSRPMIKIMKLLQLEASDKVTNGDSDRPLSTFLLFRRNIKPSFSDHASRFCFATCKSDAKLLNLFDNLQI
ncbi:hypothetical protein L2E82_17565 [Cichorium intybus]|uniref:Uncharacterized protein n=1 Tax=Cichorium intybus TaxID=13427 RepID=A0ACB9F972_CICIN|nr:hypothetical protein L2E82_17565 [Cichorium intybus]